MRSPALKRAVDVVGSALGLLLAALPMAVLAVLVRRSVGSPVLFRQERPGRADRPFTLLKFRTMRAGPTHDGGLALTGLGDGTDDGARLTPFGRWLRATSLDELPQLWNVLLGHMSLVGPRPLLVEYLDRYSPEQRRRHEVRPGLTGLAQVHGGNRLGWDERLDLDVRYVDTWTIGGDVRIIGHTLRLVTARHAGGANGGSSATLFAGDRP